MIVAAHNEAGALPLLYAATMVGAALSPVFFGQVYDLTKSYTAALYAAGGMLMVSALLFLTLRRPDDAALVITGDLIGPTSSPTSIQRV